MNRGQERFGRRGPAEDRRIFVNLCELLDLELPGGAPPRDRSRAIAPQSGIAIASGPAIGHTAGSGAAMQLPRISLSQVALLIVLGMSSAGCQAVGDIFQAGMWVGVIVVVLVLGGIAFIASKFRSGPR